MIICYQMPFWRNRFQEKSPKEHQLLLPLAVASSTRSAFVHISSGVVVAVAQEAGGSAQRPRLSTAPLRYDGSCTHYCRPCVARSAFAGDKFSAKASWELSSMTMTFSRDASAMVSASLSSSRSHTVSPSYRRPHH